MKLPTFLREFAMKREQSRDAWNNTLQSRHPMTAAHRRSAREPSSGVRPEPSFGYHRRSGSFWLLSCDSRLSERELPFTQ
jgi:hypothetical protein